MAANPSVTDGQPADVWIQVVVANMTYRNANLRDSIMYEGEVLMPGRWQVLGSLIFGWAAYEFLRHRLLRGAWLPKLPTVPSVTFRPQVSLPKIAVEIPDDLVTPVKNVMSRIMSKARRMWVANKEALFPPARDRSQALIDQGWGAYQSHEEMGASVVLKSVLRFGIGVMVVGALGLGAYSVLRYLRRSVEREMEEEAELNRQLGLEPVVTLAETPEQREERVQVQQERDQQRQDPLNQVVEPREPEPVPSVAASARVLSVETKTNVEPSLTIRAVQVSHLTDSPIQEERPVRKNVAMASLVSQWMEKRATVGVVHEVHSDKTKLGARLLPCSMCVYSPQDLRDDATAQYGVPKVKDEEQRFLDCGFHFRTRQTCLMPTVFANTYHNFVATLATRVLNERPTVNAVSWAKCFLYLELLAKGVRANPKTVQEWVETCNPNKRAHYKRALTELAEKTGPINRIPDKLAEKANGKLSFTKVECLPHQWELHTHIKPRNIMGASDLFQMYFGPWVRSIDEQYYGQFKLGSWGGPFKNIQWFKVSGVNVRELNDLVTQAIRLVTLVFNMSKNNEDPHVFIMFACGDDNWTVGCSKQLGVFYFYSDFSKFDKTHSANSLRLAEEYYKQCGVPKRVVKIWKANSKTIKGKGVSQPSVKFSCKYNLATGAPDTSLRNTVLGVAVSCVILDELLGANLIKKFDDENAYQNADTLVHHYGEFGLEAKCNITGVIEETDFLQGRFLFNNFDQKYYWIPKIGRMLSKFGYKAVWKLPIDSDQEVTDQASRVHLKSVALCYRDCYYPVVRSMCQGILRQTQGVVAAPSQDEFWKMSSTGYPAGDIEELHSQMMVSVSEFYNLEMETLLDFCSLLYNATLPLCVSHPAFDVMFRVDCPEWFYKK